MIIGVVDAESTDLVDSAGLFTISGIIMNVTDLADIEKQIADYKAGKRPEGCVHVVLNITEQYLLGRTFLASTQAWWVKKTTPAARAAILEQPTPLKEAMELYAAFIQKLIDLSKEERGPNALVNLYYRGDFDGRAIASLAKATGVQLPSGYRSNKEIRTYIDAKLDTDIGYIPWLGYPAGLERHNSLEDVLIDGFEMAVAWRINDMQKNAAKAVEAEIAKLSKKYPPKENQHV
ncbi:exonuclease [Erwinia phage AH06]|nr:exonuclease [Erwinia phage AH06]